MLKRFALDEPESVNDVPSLLAKYGENGTILAGGTELLLVMKEQVVIYEHLINVKNIPGLDKIKYDEKGGQLKIGPLVTHRALEKSDLVKEKFPLIVEMEKQVANIRIRNMGTIGGNLSFAEPHSDVGNLLLALGARVKAVGSKGERIIHLEDFFVDFFETALKEDEMLTEIQIPILPHTSSGVYLRFALVQRPTVGVAVILTFSPQDEGIEDAIITIGSINPTPVRSREAEEVIKGKSASEALANLERAGEIAAKGLDPIGDIHASVWYKREMVKVMVKRAIQEAYNRHISRERG